MRTSIVIFAAMAALLLSNRSEADSVHESGGGFVEQKHPKIGKDYYIVHRGESDKCSIVTGSFGDPPEGVLGGAPYATKGYADAALKKFPECKGGESGEPVGKKKQRKE
jgi:hypothetical protein